MSIVTFLLMQLCLLFCGVQIPLWSIGNVIVHHSSSSFSQFKFLYGFDSNQKSRYYQSLFTVQIPLWSIVTGLKFRIALRWAFKFPSMVDSNPLLPHNLIFPPLVQIPLWSIATQLPHRAGFFAQFKFLYSR